MKKKITLIKYDNPGNIGSLINLIKNINFKNNNKFSINISKKAKIIKKSDILILPGVGQFDEVMSFLNKNNLKNILREHSRKKIIIGICIGMQVFFDNSEEGDLNGLGFIRGRVKKIKDKKVPLIGWKKTLKSNNDKLIDERFDETYLYYVHSYQALPDNKKTILMNLVNNNNTITALIKQSNLIGFQFHPELSSNSGFKILESILLKYS